HAPSLENLSIFHEAGFFKTRFIQIATQSKYIYNPGFFYSLNTEPSLLSGITTSPAFAREHSLCR
ncbi:MAG TPA: hypothetical protein VLH61_02995, partial [Bacteroidales bacterium]|nr:hypothetical protein [Bacteroidales bacterium]